LGTHAQAAEAGRFRSLISSPLFCGNTGLSLL
jgi:hypothetical protein